MLLEWYEKESEAFLKPIVTGMKIGFIILKLRITTKGALGAPFFSRNEEVQGLTTGVENHAYVVLGIRRTYT